jgi:adenine-specific DNA-methyltransferase
MQALSSLIETTETRRLEASRKLKPATQTKLGQFMTPQPIAQFMAELFDDPTESEIRLLDAGAGIGSLTAAFVETVLQRPNTLQQIAVTAYEVDTLLSSYLQQTLSACQQSSNEKAIDFTAEIYQEDFIMAGADLFFLSSTPSKTFTHAILNPPYKKIQTKSAHRSILSSLGIETVNLYSAFLAITIKLLEPGGQFVAIIPRSFCNGTYYKPFRRFLLNEVGIKHIHLFESRNGLFDDGVLQENIILHGIKHQAQQHTTISSSTDARFLDLQARTLAFSQVVKPNDPEAFIYLSHHQENQEYAEQIAALPCTLKDLGIKVSTGPVVDFRLASYLEPDPKPQTFPLIYPQHCQNYFVHWPLLGAKKPNAIANEEPVRKWLYPNGHYVLVKRFSSKEEPRRISAYIHDPQSVPGEWIGFENHLNVFHIHQNGLPPELARGLALYLNSSLCDLYFRQFNGHTQVNVGDLNKLRFPNAETLIRLGTHLDQTALPEQSTIDALVEEELFIMTNQLHPDAHAREQKLNEARHILEALDFLRLQLNNRSALILLALLNMQAQKSWDQAENPLLRTKEIIAWSKDYYDVHYAPNTRETIRKDTLHYFADAALIVQNPDEPNRPINSPKWCYQVEPEALELIRSFGSPQWETKLATYKQQREGLKQRYAKIRQDQQVQVLLEQSESYQLSPGEHSDLIKAIITDFRQNFAPNSKVLYIGDTGNKWAHFDQASFQALGIQLDPHGKMPDVVIYDQARQWLILVESVTSSGTVDGKRHAELSRLFANQQAGLVYVTAFPDRQLMRRYLDSISWESEVWIAEAPDHLIHFNGERFLGPYGAKQ